MNHRLSKSCIIDNSNRRYVMVGATLAALAGWLGTTVLLAGGATAVSMSAAGAAQAAKEKKEAGVRMGRKNEEDARFAASAPNRAKEAAKAEIDKKRRMRSLAGGKTVLTSNVAGASGKTVLGS